MLRFIRVHGIAFPPRDPAAPPTWRESPSILGGGERRSIDYDAADETLRVAPATPRRQFRTGILEGACEVWG